MKHLILLLSLTVPSLSASADDHKKALVCSDVKKEDIAKEMSSHQDKILKKANLTKDQKAQIEKIRAERNELVFAQMQRVRGAHTEVIAALDGNAPNEVIRERVTNLEKERTALMTTKLDLVLAIRDLLTPEQKQKALTEIKNKLHDLCD